MPARKAPARTRRDPTTERVTARSRWPGAGESPGSSRAAWPSGAPRSTQDRVRNPQRATTTAQASGRLRKSMTRCDMVVDQPSRRYWRTFAVRYNRGIATDRWTANSRRSSWPEPKVFTWSITEANSSHVGPARPTEEGVGVGPPGHEDQQEDRREGQHGRDDLVPGQRAEEEADGHQHQADRRQADAERGHRAEVEPVVSLIIEEGEIQGRTGRSGARDTSPRRPATSRSTTSTSVTGEVSKRLDRARSPLLGHQPHRQARGRRPSGRSRTAVLPEM